MKAGDIVRVCTSTSSRCRALQMKSGLIAVYSTISPITHIYLEEKSLGVIISACSPHNHYPEVLTIMGIVQINVENLEKIDVLSLA